MGYLARRMEYKEQSHHERKKDITGKKARKMELCKPTDTRHGATGFTVCHVSPLTSDMKVKDLQFPLLGFCLVLAQYFPIVPQVFPFTMVNVYVTPFYFVSM